MAIGPVRPRVPVASKALRPQILENNSAPRAELPLSIQKYNPSTICCGNRSTKHFPEQSERVLDACFGNRVKRNPPQYCYALCYMSDESWLIPLTAMRFGCEVGAIGFHMEPIERYTTHGATQLLCDGE